ncbi:autotransporter family protein [Desulfoluna spongiiphila]|uniref:Uncharacterized conserved protein, contains a C-terminal beta-barrel porin domain n=1 Tax=Desulfoluna spongiiphila TaxID=419481 RepID=A0A1G5FM45_9BACT|nr:autotransporter domain-containing protein [Desulfoluna spongiiphila]SCY40237.1 Uncharacterized conserved protein, contains a C-terminal beta-barrel porin domain [Desulfoluna spongiiphila]
MRKRLILACIFLGMVSSAAADTLVQTSGGFINGFGMIGSFDPKYDALFFPAGKNYKILVEGDTSITAYPHKVWADVTFGDLTDPHRMAITFQGSDFDQMHLSGWKRTVQCSHFEINNADFDSGAIQLLFYGADNRLTLNNATMDFTIRSPGFIATAPMALHIGSGTNKITGMQRLYAPQTFNLDIDPGASLEFFYSGSLSATYDDERLYFHSPVSGTINGGALTFTYSNAYFNSTDQFRLINGAQLELKGSRTSLELEKLYVEDSRVVVGGNTSIQMNDGLTVKNSTLNFGSGGHLTSDIVIVTDGTVILDGSDIDSGIRGNSIIDLNHNGATTQYTQNNISDAVYSHVFIDTGSSITLNDSMLTVLDELHLHGHADININSQGVLRLFGWVSTRSSLVDLTIASGGQMNVYNTAAFYHNASSNITNNGRIGVFGEYYANGTLAGTGSLTVYDDGLLQVGPSVTRLHSATINNQLVFGPSTTLTRSTGGKFWAALDVNGGVATSDILHYGDGDVDLTAIGEVKVATLKPLTASAMDSKEFTLIASNGGAGTLQTGSNLPLVEDGTIPALIDFTVGNKNTNGKPDLTLTAAKQSVSTLTSHPALQTANHSSAASLLVNASAAGNVTITQALDALTNAQVAVHMDSIHAEPYSSYMTVALEHMDMTMNTVLNHASSGSRIATGQGVETSDVATRKRFWADASYVRGDIDGDEGLGDFNYDLFGLVVGTDLTQSEDAALGVYLAYGTQKMDEHDAAWQDFDSDIYQLGMYLNKETASRIDISGLIGYAYGQHNSERAVTLGNTTERPEADFDSHSFYGGVKARLPWRPTDWVTLSPELGLLYAYYYQESFTESGNPDLSLQVDSADAQSIVTSVGVQARFKSITRGMGLHPLAFMGYEHDWYANKNSDHTIDAALASHPETSYPFVGQNRGEHVLVTGIGLETDISSALQVSGGGMYALTSNGYEWGAGLNLSYRW